MDGVLLIDKPAGLTSAEVVRRLKSYVKPQRVGHLGTLDPCATGLLPILIGEATKLAPYMDSAEKEYHGLIQLGVETDTLDREGRVVKTAPLPELTQSTIEEVERKFTGQLTQTVPVFSAVKHNGTPLYKLARRGIPAEPPKRTVHVYSLHLTIAGDDTLAFVLVCSKGTYIRAIARDIGQALGTVAHLAELRRVRSGGFSISQSISLEQAIEQLKKREFSCLVGLRQAIPDMAEVSVDERIARRVINGQNSALSEVPELGSVGGDFRLVKLVLRDRLLAIARVGGQGPKLVRVFPRACDELYSTGVV